LLKFNIQNFCICCNIFSHDLQHMCQLLNMEDAVDEIIHHLGIVREGGDGQVRGHISFEDFMRCRLNLSNEIERERLKLESGLVHHGMYSCGVDSVSGDIPLQTPDNSDVSQGENYSVLLSRKFDEICLLQSQSMTFTCHF